MVLSGLLCPEVSGPLQVFPFSFCSSCSVCNGHNVSLLVSFASSSPSSPNQQEGRKKTCNGFLPWKTLRATPQCLSTSSATSPAPSASSCSRCPSPCRACTPSAK